MASIRIPNLQTLAEARSQAEALRQELEGLSPATEAFAEKLRALSALQMHLATEQQAGTGTPAAWLEEQSRIANAQLELQRTTGEAAVALALDQTQRRLAALQELQAQEARQVEFERQLAEARLELSRAAATALEDLSSSFNDSNQDFAAAQQALFVFSRALAIRDVIIATQREVASIGATYAAAPPLAAVLTAKAIVGGAARVALIAAQTLPKLQAGGVLVGPGHAQGGILLGNPRQGRAFAEAEGGEVVLTRAVSRSPLLLQLASRINELAGGVSLRASLSPRRMTAGGVLHSAAGDSENFNPDWIRHFAQLAETLANRPVVVSVEEINRVGQRVKVLEQNSDL